MTSRRTISDPSRHRPAETSELLVVAHRRAPDKVRVLVAQHTSAISRNIGWVITKADDREQFVTINGNDDWCWTRTRRDAAFFLTRATAERWISQQLDGKGRAMEVVA